MPTVTLRPIRLEMSQHEDYLFATCADVPGMHLAGRTREELRDSAVRAVKTLCWLNRREHVEVTPTGDPMVLNLRFATGS